MNNYSKILLTLLAVASLALVAPMATAQTTSGYGTQVKLGDSDFVPVSSTTAGEVIEAASSVLRLGFGVATDINDDCVVTDQDNDGAVENFDIRLTPCQGKAVGSQIGDSDTIEKTAAVTANVAANTAVVYADVNNNGRYDAGDCVFITVDDAAAGTTLLAPNAGLTQYTLRVTPCSGKSAGTFVFASDSDFTSYGASVANVNAGAFETYSWFDADLTGGLTAGDQPYLSPGVGAAVLGTSALFPLNSVRLGATNSAGAFGTQTKLGDRDFVPVTSTTAGEVIQAASSVLRLAFGVATDINDDCVVTDQDNDGVVENFDIRLTPCQGKAAGTQIGDSDTIEKTAAVSANVAANTAVVYADVNNNGRYDAGDCVYITVDDAAFGATLLAPNAGLTQYTLRITPCSGKAAGTFVFASDSDFTSYGASTAHLNAAGAFETYSWFDADLTGGLTSGDLAYLVPGGAAAVLGTGALFPLNAIRLSAANSAGAFGTQTKLGDSDFVPVSSTTAGEVIQADSSVLRLAFGVATDINDDCVVTDQDNDGVVENFDIRLTPCQGKAAGTQIGDSDTIEKTAAVSANVGLNTAVVYADVNNNGRYDTGDCVFLTVDDAAFGATLLAPNAGLTQYTLRITACSGKAAGTFVFASDSDFTSYGASTAHVNAGAFETYSWFDADLTGGLTAGDYPYLAPGGAAAVLGTGALFQLNSVRLFGQAPPSSSAGGNPSSSTSGTSTSGTGTNGTMTSTGTGNTGTGNTGTGNTGTGSETTTSSKNKTPGFELVALVGALGAALILVRRKL